MAKDANLRLVIQGQKSQAEGEINALIASLQKLGQAAQQVSKHTQDFANQAQQGFKRITPALDELQQKMQSIGSAMSSFGLGMAGFAASLAVPIGYSVKIAHDFEKQMNKVKAIMSASGQVTDESFKAMSDRARELGATTEYSATQAGQALQYLTQSGFTAQQSMEALPGVLNLATAAGLELGQSADIAANLMTPFGIAASNIDRVLNVLAVTSSRSNTNVSELAEAMKYAAPVAAAAGMSIEQVAATMGALANSGIKASMAGTEIRGILAALSDQTPDTKAGLARLGVETARYANGQVDLIETLRRLKQANMSASDAFQIFTRHTAAGAVAIANNISKVDELTEAMSRDTTAANRMADTMRQGLAGALQQLESAYEELANSLADPFLSTITAVVRGITGVISGIVAFIKQFPFFGNVIAAGAGVLAALAGILGIVTLAGGGLIYMVGSFLTLGQRWRETIDVVRSRYGAQKIAIDETTAAINRQTIAVNALSAANQRKIDLVMKNAPETVSTGRNDNINQPQKPSYGLKGAAYTAGTVAAVSAFSGSDIGDTVKYAAIAAGIELVVVNAGKLISMAGAWISSMGGMKAAILSLVPAIKAAGAAIAAFAAGPIGVIIIAVAALAASVAGIYYALKTRSDAIEIEKERISKNAKDLDRVVKEGFDPKKNASLLSFAELKTDSLDALKAKVKQAGTDVIGFNEMLLKARDSGDKAAEETAKKNLDIAQQNRKMTLEEYNGRKNVEEVIKKEAAAWDQVGNSMQKANLTMIERAQLAKEAGALELKILKDSISAREQANQNEIAQRNIALSESIKSEVVLRQTLDSKIIEDSQNRLALINEENSQAKGIRKTAYDLQKSFLEKELKDNASNAEAKKQLHDLDKGYIESEIEANKQLGEAIRKELDSITKAKEQQVNRIRELEKQIQDEQKNTAEAMKAFSNAGLNDYQKTQSKVGGVIDKLQQAKALVPILPERALELFKQVRSEASGMVADIESINGKIRDTATFVDDAVKKITRAGITGGDFQEKFLKQDISDISKRATEAVQAGRLGEAEQLYKQAITLATDLPSKIQKTGDYALDQQNDAKAKQEALGIVDVMANNLKDVQAAQKAQSETNNSALQGAAQQAGDSIQNLLKMQMDSARLNIAALNENTAALRGRLQTVEQQQAATQQKAAEQYAQPTQQKTLAEIDPYGAKVAEQSKRSIFNDPAYLKSVQDAAAARGKAAWDEGKESKGWTDSVFDGLKNIGQTVSDFVLGATKQAQAEIEQKAGQTAQALEQSSQTFAKNVDGTGEKFLTNFEQRIAKVFQEKIGVDITVADNRSAEATITRVG